MDWVKLSDFGKTEGAHGGVWECPDLFPMKYNNQTYWVLLVNLNPGGPNTGSATQYFIGDFDGKEFKANSKTTKWADYGPDEYAGVTWSNTGTRRILIGWMSNWQYANVVPTEKFRNAFTLPRELGLTKVEDELYLTSLPINELKSIEKPSKILQDILVNDSLELTTLIGKISTPSKFEFNFNNQQSFAIEFSNTLNEKVIIGYDKEKNSFFLDRTKSGVTNFEKDFARINFAPRLVNNEEGNMTIFIDKSSFEMFADNGLSLLTSVIFPNEDFIKIKLTSSKKILINKMVYTPLHSIW
jgi:fructan beta-fructosidase